MASVSTTRLNIDLELERLCGLPVFADGRLARELPALKVRRASRPPRSRLGFAGPSEWRLSVTVYSGIRQGDLEEVLLHEIVHLHVGVEPGRRRWHGRRFKETLHRAMGEAYGIDGARPRSVCHGAYADELERRRAASRAAAREGDQLLLPLALAQ